jgi:ABC-type bacteriocin/lantibiotic exporter with double-glycine peptidase domain
MTRRRHGISARGLLTMVRARRVRVPFVAQMQAADCGAACLAAVVRAYGTPLSMRDARRLCNVGRDGARASDIVRAARVCGFEAHGARTPLAALDPATLPAIAHVRNEHYVVLERMTKRWVTVMDPSLGRRRLPRREFRREFSRVVIAVRPAEGTVRARAVRHVALPRVVAMYRRLGRRLGRPVAGAAAATAVLQVSSLLTPLVVANAVAPSGFSWRALAALLVATGAVCGAFAVARGRLLLAIKTAHDRTITSELVGHVVGLDLPYFHTRSSADLLSRLTGTASIRDALSAVAVTSLVDAAAAALYLTGLMVVNTAVGLFALAVSAMLVAVPVVAYRWTRVHSLTQLERRSVGHAKLVTLLLGIEQAKAHAAEHLLAREWSEVYETELAAMRRAATVDNRAQAVTATLRLVAAPALVLIAQATTGSLVEAVAFGLSAAAFLGPVGNVTASVTNLVSVHAHVMRVEDVLEEPAAPQDTRERVRRHVTIELDAVVYRYPGAAAPALDGVTLTVAPGETVAVVGDSGCGKSTLARVLAGLLAPDEGSLRHLDAHGRPCLPAIGYVAQTIALYPGTVRSNVTFGRDAIPAEVDAAIAAAGLSELVASLRMGLDTPVIDGGHAFSGGQRQRIAIARALLGTPPVLILDEATSNLDARSEEHVLDALARTDCTTILVAHGPKPLRVAHIVVHMRAGRVERVERRTAPPAPAREPVSHAAATFQHA